MPGNRAEPRAASLSLRGDHLRERQIQAALDEAMADKTVIVIAHRLSTIAHLDRVLVFAKGQIVEDGSHAELLALRGEYHRLWCRQSGGVLPEAHAAADHHPPAAGPEPDSFAAARERIADGAGTAPPELA